MKLVGRVAVAILLLYSPGLLAQYYFPNPAPVGQTVLCTSCRGLSQNKPIWPFSHPIKRFVGRYVDSQATRDYQHGTGYRTIRAKDVLIAPERDRIYIAMGETFAAYKLSTFFTSKLGSPLSTIEGYATPGEFREAYLPWDASVYPEGQEARADGWKTNLVDGQVRLFQSDYDNRGMVYIGYSIFGWAIVEDQGSILKLKYQRIDAGGNTDEPAIRVLSFQRGGNYYLIVSGGGLQAKVYDVTNPVSPFLVRTLPFSAESMRKTADHSVIAFVQQSGLQLMNTDSIFSPGLSNPLQVPRSPGASFLTVATDGNRFYAVESYNGGGNIVTLTPSVPGQASSYTDSRISFPHGTPQSLEYGAGYLTIWGRTAIGYGNTWLYKVQNGVPDEVNTNNYFGNYYNSPPAGYAKPEGYTNNPEFSYVVVYRHAGKEYLIYSGYGLGDVYEIQTRDVIDIDINRGAGYGTPNTNAPLTDGPFYGDQVTFSSTGTGPPANLNWNFGNPESLDNTATASVGAPVSHRFSGITSAAAITSTKIVSAVSTADSEINDQQNVLLKLPVPRISLLGLNFLFTQANASSAPVVLGDQLSDASDGTVEGHYSVWAYDAPSTLHPSQGLPVGQCGPKTVTLTPHYAPYAWNGSSVIPSGVAPYTPAAGPFAFSVRPFVAGVDINAAASAGSMLTFDHNKTRFGPGVSPPATVDWQILPDGPVVTQAYGALFQTPKSPALNGKTVRLRITAAAVPAGCEGYSSSYAEFQLKAADPEIMATGCTNVGGACSLRVDSRSASSQVDWTYRWRLDGIDRPELTTQKTINASPYFTTAGVHSAEAIVSNSLGIDVPESKPVTLAMPSCTGNPIAAITYSAPSGCYPSGPACAAGETITFGTRIWSGRQLQACDVLEWSFGYLGQTGSGLNPTFSYPGDGFYTVNVRLNGAQLSPVSVQVGSGTPPPPPPPPSPTCPTQKPSNIIMKVQGSSPSCNDSQLRCNRNETINFEAAAFFLYTFQSCDSIEWSFGDGTGPKYGRVVAHQFGGAQPSYVVTVAVRNSMGESIATKNIQMEGTAIAPPTNVDFTTSVEKGALNQSVRFTASATSEDPNTTYRWSFGHFQGNGDGKTVEHVFTVAGQHNVTLTVTNAGGSGQRSKLFEVSNEASFAFLLPAVAHLSQPAKWRTDLHIYDPNFNASSPLKLNVEFKGDEEELLVTASTFIYEDLMKLFTDGDDAGAFIIRGTAATVPQIWTRTYIISETGGTYGQLIPAVPLPSTQNLETGAPALILAGLRETSRYRSNVGLINITSVGVDAVLQAFDDRNPNLQIGSDVPVPVGPFQLAQVNMRAKIPTLPADRPFSVRIIANPSGAILGYGSMIDNVSQDPVFISAISEGDQSSNDFRIQLLPGVAHFGLWRTDATIYNADNFGINFKLTYIDTSGNELVSADFAAQPRTFIQIDDIGSYVVGDSIGHLRMEMTGPSGRNPIIYGRTYNDRQGLGTFGQGIQAFAPEQANVKPGKPAYVAGIRGDSYRTNVGLVAAGLLETVVRISLLDDKTGAVVVSRDHTLRPNQSLTQPVIGLDDANFMHRLATRGTAKIEILSGGSVWAYASIIDKTTGDPEYVPAVPLN